MDLFKAASGEWGLLHSCGKVTLAYNWSLFQFINWAGEEGRLSLLSYLLIMEFIFSSLYLTFLTKQGFPLYKQKAEKSGLTYVACNAPIVSLLACATREPSSRDLWWQGSS